MKFKRLIKIITILGVVSVTLFACVKEIYPDLELTDVKKVVISGQLTDLKGYQYVSVSYSSDASKPVPRPIEHCVVKFEDSNGLEYNYSEYHAGEYRIWLDSAVLNLNLNYRLVVVLPNNQRIVSSWEKAEPCAQIGNIYENVETVTGSYYNSSQTGVQFYLNFRGDEKDSRYYKYDLVETFEYHTQYPVEWWYDGVIHHVVPPDYSKHICYNIVPIRDIFTLSTENLNENKFDEFKLNFVINKNQRLSHTYSLLVRQIALDYRAFTYWNQMKINMHQQGGLYNTQPIAIKGNLTNTSDTTKDVLGYFVVAQAHEKRVFINGYGLTLFDNNCSTLPLRYGVRQIWPDMYPAYLMAGENGYKNILLSVECVDCTTVGNGTTVKPSYWP